MLAVLGITGLLLADRVRSGLQLSTGGFALFFFVNFGIADLAHDCLLIPGRVVIGDVAAERASNPVVYERGHAVFGAMQCIGRLAAEVCKRARKRGRSCVQGGVCFWTTICCGLSPLKCGRWVFRVGFKELGEVSGTADPPLVGIINQAPTPASVRK